MKLLERIAPAALLLACTVGFVSCAAPTIEDEAVAGLVGLVDERVDAYLEADSGLDAEAKLELGRYGDRALALVNDGEPTSASELQAQVAPLWGLEVQYTLADAALDPRVKAAFLRNGRLVLTICTRAQGLPDPAPVVVPGAGVLAGEPDD